MHTHKHNLSQSLRLDYMVYSLAKCTDDWQITHACGQRGCEYCLSPNEKHNCYSYAKQKHPGCKKCKAKQKQHCNWVQILHKSLISTKIKKLFSIETPLSYMTYNGLQSIFKTMIAWLYHLATFIVWCSTKRWPSDKANHSHENTL